MASPPAAALRIPYLVTTASSEDDMSPALQLQVRDTASSQGWQSAKLCEYPQVLVLMVNHGTPMRIATMQVLVHHTKIPTRIDVSIAETAPSKLRKLGYVLCDANDASNFNARELKSITINCDVAYLQLTLQQCHRNRFNVYDQVGLVDVALFGPSTHPSPPKPQLNPVHPPNNQAPKSPRSAIDPAALELYFIPHPSHLGTRLSLRQVVEALRIQRAARSDAEDYAGASAIKDMERTVCQCLVQLERLHLQKNDVVRAENYDAATLVNTEIDQVLGRVTAIAAESTLVGPQQGKPTTCTSGSPKKRRDESNPPTSVQATLVSRQRATDAQLATPPTEPEPLESALGMACADILDLLAPLDDRALRCAYSQHRSLREPAVAAVVGALQDQLSKISGARTPPGVTAAIVLKPWLTAGILQQPYHAFSSGSTFAVAAISTLHASLSTSTHPPSPEAVHRELLQPLLSILIQRLGDSSARVRNKAGVSMLEIATSMGVHPVLSSLLTSFQINGTAAVHWRQLSSLVRTTTALLEMSECSVEPSEIQIVDFIHAQRGFGHAMAQVTEAATQFAIALYHNLGEVKADECLACLEAAQRASYKQIVADDEWHQPPS
ncbi:hypothetical protein H310_00803 [Aphanomyces invadans]|uniref:Centrosomal protein CEP104 N-terminal domain-containing protein n=1 Tax=Aphanomyces invadans TaxID=157072 RepID=A0A024UW07_9STRA|nr:hypothetical protein H310_00803 [Aphanomyces invadans]ETW10519.1 hypothetical protein H310_00803 [Aphanomyces invadans]|eukprot:XP_008861930.1 hypothetical protein H310_00803 [Aphanomyces invadans]